MSQGTTQDPDLKGKYQGNCNRQACQKPGAVWFNISTRAYYCTECAHKLNAYSIRADGYPVCRPA